MLFLAHIKNLPFDGVSGEGWRDSSSLHYLLAGSHNQQRCPSRAGEEESLLYQPPSHSAPDLRDRQTGRETGRETERDREKDRESERESDREREIQRETAREPERHTQRERERETQRER